MNLQMIDFKPKQLRVPEWVKNVAATIFVIVAIIGATSFRYAPEPKAKPKTMCSIRQPDYLGNYNETVSYSTFDRLPHGRCLVSDDGHLFKGYEEAVDPVLPVLIDSPIK